MESKLPPIDFSEDIERYEAKEEKVTLKESRCPHTQTTIKGNTLTCVCGASWQGVNIHKLKELLDKPNTV